MKLTSLERLISSITECYSQPNVVASSWKLGSTCDSVWPGLALHLRWLAMTCALFGRDQICTQVKASFSTFCHPTQVNASWVTSIKLLLANEIEATCVYLRGNLLTSPFGHPTEVSTQVQLGSTCDYLPVRLNRALGHNSPSYSYLQVAIVSSWWKTVV